jgi:hypothetical protein
MPETFDDDVPEPDLDDDEALLDIEDDDELAALDDDIVDDEDLLDELTLPPRPPAVDDEPGEEALEAEAGEEVEGEDDIVEIEEELHPDDVEEALDVLLREKIAAAPLDDEEAEDEEEAEPDDRGEGATRIVPRQEGEFHCASCFLVKPMSQLAEQRNGRMTCRDCV